MKQFELFKKLLDVIETHEIESIRAEEFMREGHDHGDYNDLIAFQESDEFAQLEDDVKEQVKEFTSLMEHAECVEDFGGEGQGEDYYSVWHFPKIDLYVKFEGWYASGTGSEYNRMYEVKPKEVTVTKYNAV